MGQGSLCMAGSAGVVVVANAPFTWTVELTAIAGGAELVVAADGGADALARIGLQPHMVVGDLDSIGKGCRRWLGESRLLHRPDQDHTDLEKTLEYVLGELAAGGATVLGALGGRIDHTIHNLGLLARYQLGRDLIFRGAQDETFAVAGQAVLPSQPGETWSFWTFDPSVLVTIDGVRWPVAGCRLDPAGQPSTSNQTLARQVRVVAEGGPVLIRRRIDRRIDEGQTEVTAEKNPA